MSTMTVHTVGRKITQQGRGQAKKASELFMKHRLNSNTNLLLRDGLGLQLLWLLYRTNIGNNNETN